MDSVFRGLAVYLVLLVVTRSAGRRTMAKITVFDFVLLLIIAETTDQALLGDDSSVVNAAIVIVTLVLTDVALSYLKSWSPRMAKAIDGTPTVLMSRGQLDHEALSRSRVAPEDILDSARDRHGLMRLDQIEAAVLEVSGGISVIPKEKTPP